MAHVVLRFVRAVETWMTSLVEQSRNRSTDEIPSVEDFINLRRRTIGGPVAEGVYSGCANVVQTDFSIFYSNGRVLLGSADSRVRLGAPRSTRDVEGRD